MFTVYGVTLRSNDAKIETQPVLFKSLPAAEEYRDLLNAPEKATARRIVEAHHILYAYIVWESNEERERTQGE